MANTITITQKQTPTFRALIRTTSGTFFNYAEHLATAEELTAEGIDAPPASFSIRKSNSALAPYDVTGANSEPVDGYTDVEIGEDAFLTVDDGESATFNFQFTPESRAVFPFAEIGYYLVDFLLYPKTGAAIVFRVGVTVK